MKRNERVQDLTQTLIAALQGWQADIWSAMPGIIQSVNFAEQTCVVQVAIQMQVTDPTTGSKSWTSISPLLDCPLFFPHGGNCSITFPVAAGDECFVVFASRCIDSWFQSGDVSPQALYRMHDLSDGFVFAGFRSQPKVISGISSSKLQIRSADGNTEISLDPSGTVDIKATHVTVEATNIDMTGNVSVTGSTELLGTLTVSGVAVMAESLAVGTTLSVDGSPYASHIHTGGTLTGGHTGPPI